MAGCGAPPVDETSRERGEAASAAPWMHITRDALYSGAGMSRQPPFRMVGTNGKLVGLQPRCLLLALMYLVGI